VRSIAHFLSTLTEVTATMQFGKNGGSVKIISSDLAELTPRRKKRMALK
jgi:hypothetical protein